MSNNPGDPSHENVPLPEPWNSLEVHMVQVEHIMRTLDDFGLHTLLTDEALLGFVRQLNAIKDTISMHKTLEYEQQLTVMADHLRDACQGLNLTIIEYRKKKSLNKAGYNCLRKGCKSLSHVVDVWTRIRRSFFPSE